MITKAKLDKVVLRIIMIIFIVMILITMIFLVSYPTKYKSEINQYARKYNLPTSMIASVIKIESNYNKNSVSDAGAMGLMQLMPSTAEEMAKKMKIDFDTNDLFDVDVNIDIGCYYLRYLYEMFDKNIDNTLSAYNWGLNNVKSWILRGNSDGYGTITNIPVSETNNYLKKYHRAKFMYSNIFGYDM